MSITIPFFFRTRWTAFFNTTLASFLGYSTYGSATPIVKAIIDFSRLAVAFLILWFILKIFMKGIRLLFK